MKNKTNNTQNKRLNNYRTIIYLVIVSFIILLLLIFILKNFSFSNTDKKEDKSINLQGNNFLKIDNSIDNIKRILDSSMISNGFTYYIHHEISSPDNRLNTISFLYFNNQNNKADLPSIKEMESTFKKSEDLKVKGNNLMKQAQEKSDNEMAQEAASMMVEADRLISQEDKFYTIEIGKDTSTPPIVMVQQGLPEWIIMNNKALALAEEHFGERAKIVEIERTTLGTHCIYIALNSKGDSIYINAHSGKVFSKRTLHSTNRIPQQNNDSQKEKERTERMKSQWQEFMRNGINIKDFSLEGLTDLSKQTKK